MSSERPLIFRLIAHDDPLGLGSEGATPLRIAAIGKRADSSGPYRVANEFVCAEVARFLRLPAPPGALVGVKGNVPWFASLDFNLEGQDTSSREPCSLLARATAFGGGSAPIRRLRREH